MLFTHGRRIDWTQDPTEAANAGTFLGPRAIGDGATHPEASGPHRCRIIGGKRRLEFFRMAQVKEAACHQHFKRTIEGEERLKQVLLGPEPTIFQNPLFGILRRKENIMAVNYDTRLQARQDIEVFTNHVSTDLDDVTRINEEDIILLEAAESLDGYGLDFRFKEFGEARDSATKELGGMGLDRC